MPEVPPKQREEVLAIMRDGNYYTLPDLSRLLNQKYLTTSISARLRELRLERFGGWTVEKILVGTGSRTYAYRLVPKREPQQLPLEMQA